MPLGFFKLRTRDLGSLMTFNQTRSFLCGFLLLASASTFADTAPKSNWDGTKASAGLSITTGNANNSNINGEFDINYARGEWKNLAVISGQYGKNEGVLNKKQYLLQNQVFLNVVFVDYKKYFLYFCYYKAFYPLHQK